MAHCVEAQDQHCIAPAPLPERKMIMEETRRRADAYDRIREIMTANTWSPDTLMDIETVIQETEEMGE